MLSGNDFIINDYFFSLLWKTTISNTFKNYKKMRLYMQYITKKKKKYIHMNIT